MAIDTSNFLTSLINVHEDLMSNLYLVSFYPPSKDGDGGADTGFSTPDNLAIRVKSFKAPTPSHATHKVDFMTTSIDIPSPGIELTKSFDLTFRLDSNYKVYDFLRSWQKKNLLDTKDFAGTHVLGEGGDGEIHKEKANEGFQIKVELLVDRSDEVNDQRIRCEKEEKEVDGKMTTIETEKSSFGATSIPLYTFKHCWVSAIKGLDYSYDSNDPLEVTATIHYFSYTMHRGTTTTTTTTS